MDKGAARSSKNGSNQQKATNPVKKPFWRKLVIRLGVVGIVALAVVLYLSATPAQKKSMALPSFSTSYVVVALAPLVMIIGGVAVTIIQFSLAKRPLSIALAYSLIPVAFVLAFAIWKGSLAYAVVAAMLIAFLVISRVYERHVPINDDVASTLSWAPALLLWPFNPGTVQSANLSSLYSNTLVSALTLIGLIFTVSIFFLQTQE